ncbi:MAG: hypothetical protein WDO18_23115 [Acidobacteriota bacterium]
MQKAQPERNVLPAQKAQPEQKVLPGPNGLPAPKALQAWKVQYVRPVLRALRERTVSAA